jgi:hypothetical protein
LQQPNRSQPPVDPLRTPGSILCSLAKQRHRDNSTRSEVRPLESRDDQSGSRPIGTRTEANLNGNPLFPLYGIAHRY